MLCIPLSQKTGIGKGADPVKSSTLLALALVLALGACSAISGSRLNPFNWFGGSRAQTNQTVQQLAPNERADGRFLVDQVIALRINRTPGGAIVEAVGLPPTQGYWSAELVALNDGRAADGVLSYEFRVARPTSPQAQGIQQSREITVAAAVSNLRLNGVRQIRVIGARNSRSSSR